MNYLLFAVYCVALCWLLLRIPFLKNAGLDPKVLLGLFIIKVMAGIAIGWISINMYGPGNDYWDNNDYAWQEYQLLWSDPGTYFSNLFISEYGDGFAGVFNSYGSYWNDLRNNIIIKMVSVFNLLSRGDYYINSLFFNFIIFFAHVILYRLFIKLYPGKKIAVIIGCFLLPSTLYFSSGIHKDGFVLLLMSIIMYCVYQSLSKGSFNGKRVVLLVISMLLLFLVRNVVLLLMLPALFAWVLAYKTKRKPVFVFGAMYLLSAVLFFSLGKFSKIEPMQLVITKQTEYAELTGAETQIAVTALQPNFKSFAMNAPEALNHSFLRPYLFELPVLSLLPLNIELLIYQLLFILLIFWRVKNAGFDDRHYLWFAVFFILSAFLLIGYVVPNLGSLVRYRSIYLPLIITPLICQINWPFLKRKLYIKNINM